MDKIQKMYTGLRRAESQVRGLTYQKKLILLQLGGYEVTSCRGIYLYTFIVTFGMYKQVEIHEFSVTVSFNMSTIIMTS